MNFDEVVKNRLNKLRREKEDIHRLYYAKTAKLSAEYKEKDKALYDEYKRLVEEKLDEICDWNNYPLTMWFLYIRR